MRAKEFINETASAGASGAGGVATVSMPMGSIQKRKKRVGEGTAITDEYLEVRFNNENAYETAYRLFGDVWEEPNAEQIFIHEKYLGKLEDALFSRGYEEGEDYEIEAVDVHDIDYSLYDPEYDDEYDDEDEFSEDDIPPHAWSSSTAGKR